MDCQPTLGAADWVSDLLLPLRNKCLAVSCVNNPLDFVDGLPTMTTVSKKKWVLEPGCGSCRGFEESLSGKQSVVVLSDYCIRRRPKKEAVSASGTIAAALPGLGEMLGTRILASRCCVGCTKIMLRQGCKKS